MNIVTYLLPLSGEMLLSSLQNMDFINVKASFIPESYVNDCQTSIQYLESNDIPYCIPTSFDNEVQSWFESFDLDLGLSVGYDKILPKWAFDGPSNGTINLHPSLLPQYRGANPYFWVIRNRESETGVSLHYMDEGLDTGPVIDRSSVLLDDSKTMGELFKELNRLGIDRMVKILKKWEQGASLPDGDPQPQSNDFPEAPKLQSDDLRINWDEPYHEIDALIRAGNPHYGACTTFKGEQIRIYEIERVTVDAKNEQSLEPATIRKTERGPIVKCDDAWCRLESVQVNQKYIASGKEFQRREQDAFTVLSKVV